MELLLRAATTGALRLAGTAQGGHDGVLERGRESPGEGRREKVGRERGRKGENESGRAALCNSLPSSVVAVALLPRVEPRPLLTATCTQYNTQIEFILTVNCKKAHVLSYLP